ncbi:MAG: PKD domain-containing protein, partial [Thermoanaerobaculia bacterium]|nr:PKD domain-containing protein [Thermoanaerobaculia bacterium]
DDRAQGGITYVYQLRGVDGCGEGPASQPLVVTATGACDLLPRFFGILEATPNSPDCSVTLEWAEATAGCTLGDGVAYNIYRTTDPDQFPGDPTFTVTDTTTFTDITVESGIQYHYIVRAEDLVGGGTGPNDGNEEDNSIVRSAVVVGPPGEVGTWTDDGGDTTALLAGEFPWRIATSQAQGGTSSYHAGIADGNYPAETCAPLVTPELTLAEGALLTYWARYDLEREWDGVVVEISTDGGENWSDLPPDEGYPGTLAQTQDPPVNACGYPSTQGAFTGPFPNGQLTEWTEYTSDLSSFAEESVLIRWRLTTDPATEVEGFYLDTISITSVAIPDDCIPVVLEPEAAFAVQTRSPLSGSPVAFIDESEGNPTSWLWEFGDSATSNEQNPIHVYSEPGRYEVTLTVMNSSGSDVLSRSVRIFDPALGYQAKMITPGQARAAGSGGSFFKSAFWLTNLAATESIVRLHYLPTPGTPRGGAEETVLLSILPGESIAYRDVLGEALGATENTFGGIVVEVGEGMPAPVVTARTYNEPSAVSGTFGQYIPAVSLLDPSDLTIRMDGLGGDVSNRSNVGIANLTAETIGVTITVLDQEGTPVGTDIPVSLPAFSATQVNQVNVAAGAGRLAVFSVRISGTGPFFAYASKLDNTTSDPIFIPDSLQPASEQWIDGVGATPGAGGTFFRSDLSIANRGETDASVEIAYVPWGSTAPAGQTTLTVPATETLFFNDALSEIFSLSGAGLFRLTTSEGTPVVAWARTYNDRGNLGTLGQFIPGFRRSDLIGASGGLLQGLSDDADFRTNLGIVNVSDREVGVTIEAWTGGGVKAGEQFRIVQANGTLFIPTALSTISDSEITDGYVIIRPGTGGAIYAWASYVDNRSTDQTFVRPLPVP